MSDQELSVEAIQRIENELYVAVLRRVTRTVLIAVALFVAAVGGMGWLAWRSVRTRLAEDALQMLQSDDSLHSELLGAIAIDTAAISARLREALGQMDPALGVGPETLSDADLAAMRGMIEQLLSSGTELKR